MKIDRIISAVVATTGEVVEYSVKTPSEVTRAYKDITAHIEAYRLLKNSVMETSVHMMDNQDELKADK